MTKLQKILIDAYNSGWRVKGKKLYDGNNNEKTTYVNKNGYVSHHIYLNGYNTNLEIHRLVAYQKYGDEIFKIGIEVRHIDGDRTNFMESNIIIGTHQDNMLDIPSNIRLNSAMIATKYIRRFNDLEVIEILNDRKDGMTYKQLCEKWNTSKSTLSYFFNHSLYGKT